jgi:RNA polymerase sigma-70 factor (ECF subfamily)
VPRATSRPRRSRRRGSRGGASATGATGRRCRGCSGSRNVLHSPSGRDRIETRARERLGLPLDLAVEDGYADVDERLSPRRDLAGALAGLPEHERQALELRVVAGLDYAEVADELEDAIRRQRRRAARRLAVRTAAVTAAAFAVALGGLSVLPGDDPTAVARAAAALTGPDGTILHIVPDGTWTDADGTTVSYPVESWQDTSPPYDSRRRELRPGGGRIETGSAEGVAQSYDPRTATILTVPWRPKAEPPNPNGRGAWPDPLAPDFSAASLRELLESGQAREDGRTVVGGREAIRIVTAVREVTLLVDASTYDPIELRLDDPDGPGTSKTIRFRTYERLPATPATRALVSLAASHPGAAMRVAPQDAGGTERKGAK